MISRRSPAIDSRSALSVSSGRSIISICPAPGSTTVSARAIAPASARPAFSGDIWSRSPRISVVGQTTFAAAALPP